MANNNLLCPSLASLPSRYKWCTRLTAAEEKGHRYPVQMPHSLCLWCYLSWCYINQQPREKHLQLHRGKRSTGKKESYRKGFFVRMNLTSKWVFCVINSQSWASQGRPCEYLLCSVVLREFMCLTYTTILQNRPPRGTTVMMNLLLIGLPSSTSPFRLDLQGFSGLAKNSRGLFQ